MEGGSAHYSDGETSESEQKKLAVVEQREFQRTARQVEPVHIGCILTNQTVDK